MIDDVQVAEDKKLPEDPDLEAPGERQFEG
jgi:hypothetical protein